jgi:hypothetical protein
MLGPYSDGLTGARFGSEVSGRREGSAQRSRGGRPFPGVACLPPPLVEAELLMVIPRRLGEAAHRCSQSRSCPSDDKSMICLADGVVMQLCD